MATITSCTLTGVDEQTDVNAIAQLSAKHPIVEWGFLYSPTRQGQPGRYPSVQFLHNTLKTLPAHTKVALHICGVGVAQLIAGEPVASALLERVSLRGGRVQLNFSAGAMQISLTQLRTYIEQHPNVQFITQHNSANEQVWRHLQDLPNHSILFDNSGGKGIQTAQWLPPLPNVRCGYAGGLGPDNIATEWSKISTVAGNSGIWIDMESKLRDAQDWLDLDRAKTVLETIARHTRPKRPKIFPVIHYHNQRTAFEETQKAIEAGADGIFLIAHHGDDMELLAAACAIKADHHHLPIGVNFLSTDGLDGVIMASKFNLPMVWGDNLGVDSKGLSEMGLNIRNHRAQAADKLEVFASVAFKYRPPEPNPQLAAKNALEAGFIPTTSGSGTGVAPDLSKIVAMSKATGGVLAVASGMTPENVSNYAPYLSHILVATGVAMDAYRMDVTKLTRLIANAGNFQDTGIVGDGKTTAIS